MAYLKRHLLISAATLVATSAHADYFFDQGFVTAPIRTEYNASNEGTAANPLTMGPYLWPCTDPLLNISCQNSPVSFPQSNFWSFNGGATATNFWALTVNNEPWWGSTSGPPDASLPVSAPGSGTMGFAVIKDTPAGENFYRAHFVVNNQFNPQAGAIPYLGLTAVQSRGNGSRVGALNSSFAPHTVHFTAKLWDYVDGVTGNPGRGFYLFATAYWNSKPRDLFILLHSWGEIYIPAGSAGVHKHWNWPITESFYYPGADLAFIDAAAIHGFCPYITLSKLVSKNQQITYNVDLQAAFQCASNYGLFDTPLPAGTIPLTAVGWAAEISGEETGLWVSVHDMSMLAPTSSPPADDGESYSVSTFHRAGEKSLTASFGAAPRER